MPKFRNREGEASVNAQGIKMIVKAYRGTHDIDVEFEDGALRQHMDYIAFKKGQIRHPADAKGAKAESRVGERRRNNQGKMMEITAYRTGRDVDVRFKGGAVRKHVRYSSFRKGEIRHPDDTDAAKAESRIGERNRNSRGQTMEIVAYRRANDIDVRFEDGAVKEHVVYGNFKKGNVSHPDDAAGTKAESRIGEHIGERKENRKGQMMEITAYRGSDDIDVEFEDGTVREHMRYSQFKAGRVCHPNDRNRSKTGERLGERGMNSRGQMMEIDAYRNRNDIDVRFEDGTVREHMQYGNFKKGMILHP